MWKLNWLIESNCLRFLNTGQDLVQNQGCWLKNNKLDLWPGFVVTGIKKTLKSIYILLTTPTALDLSQQECLFCDFVPQRAFSFDHKYTESAVQIIPYHHVAKQFLRCLFWLIIYFQFQSMFLEKLKLLLVLMKKIFHKALHKTQNVAQTNYVIPRVNRLSSPAFFSWLRAFNFRIWFGKWKNAVSAKALN